MGNNTVSYYLSLPYTRRCEPRSEGTGEPYWVAWIQEIPSLRIDGETREEALGKLNECLGDFLAMMLENNDEIPKPDRWPDNVGVPLNERAAPSAEEGLSQNPDVDTQVDESEWSSDRPEPAFV